METKILYGKNLAEKILSGVRKEVKELKGKGVNPCLMTVQVGEDAASRVYLNSQQRQAETVGINCELLQLSAFTTQARLMRTLDNINEDPAINGIILHMPLPSALEARAAQWRISHEKDIEGVTPYNLGRLFLGAPLLAPCTALAAVELIKSTGVNLAGKEVTIIGSSDIVGKPCAIMLLKENATVTVCHIGTYERGYLEEHVRRAEILVVAIGRPNTIRGEWIKEGAIVIDVGINAVGDKIVGDVEFEEACKRAAFISPVPGGAGAVTVAFLLQNLVKATKWQLAKRASGLEQVM
ncbi:MAG: bifunctional 5,10-methylenetetrahydrofolate dehydrogenase/5,10-methenyltetrahydrofolate cyclohydrolase [Syntrophomonadaceae bacterium]|nr:bifunctional 5,10-methylenetetrahydrofolate dehydrogenase/5,10-methenyltetrahydrofolate cyclohydrolase [Syntrophomonadaceae bacterium]